ncbi:serum amyloid P-component-like [Anoplopoma fimbria]|uniref:serum amyloid P-component-like n=1 Tax=Anoplopoma fimbria TaxID=229290 RepID=UPI0023EB47CE|nr:serum amyloid P-component-like [Anoplopoma fimbria]
MAFFYLLLMLTACAAGPQDMCGKMLVFPEETSTASVRLITSQPSFSSVTVCLRSITDLSRTHALFSVSTSSADNAFLIFKVAASDEIQLHVDNKWKGFGALDYKLNAWQSICSTWDSASGLGQLWLDGKPTIKKFLGGSKIINPITILGQEQDSHGGGFDLKQSFVGMMSDVHMWNYVLSPCEIQNYVDDLNFTPGNLINWSALVNTTTGRVLIENKQTGCCMNMKCKRPVDVRSGQKKSQA